MRQLIVAFLIFKLVTMIFPQSIRADEVKQDIVSNALYSSEEKTGTSGGRESFITTGLWYVSWEQISDNASRFGNQAINVNYDIEDTLAPFFSINLKYNKIYLGVNYSDAEESEDCTKKLSSFASTLNYMGLADALDFQISYMRGTFEGYIEGSDKEGTSGSGTFNTELNIYDLILYPVKYAGLGYRYFDYELPQDLYLVSKKNPNNALLAGFEEISYSGHFFQVVLDNERILNYRDHYNGLAFSIAGGYGILKSSGKFLDKTEALLKAENLLPNDESLMSDGKAWFINGDLGYKFKSDIGLFSSVSVYAGYRYSELKAEFDETDTYSLVSDFTTKFSGPFVNLSLIF